MYPVLVEFRWTLNFLCYLFLRLFLRLSILSRLLSRLLSGLLSGLLPCLLSRFSLLSHSRLLFCSRFFSLVLSLILTMIRPLIVLILPLPSTPARIIRRLVLPLLLLLRRPLLQSHFAILIDLPIAMTGHDELHDLLGCLAAFPCGREVGVEVSCELFDLFEDFFV